MQNSKYLDDPNLTRFEYLDLLEILSDTTKKTDTDICQEFNRRKEE